jgi:hypothetical protein
LGNLICPDGEIDFENKRHTFICICGIGYNRQLKIISRSIYMQLCKILVKLTVKYGSETWPWGDRNKEEKK